METHVNFNSFRIIPAPRVSFSRQYQTTDDGTKIGAIWSIVINGDLVTGDRGSPSSSGSLWDQTGYPTQEDTQPTSALASILAKQKALSDLFSKDNDGKSLEFQSGDGSAPCKCYPRILGIEFQEGLWFNRATYTVTLE